MRSAAIRPLGAQSAGLVIVSRISEVLFPTKVFSLAGAYDIQESTIDESDQAKTFMFLWSSSKEIEQINWLSVAKIAGLVEPPLFFAATIDTEMDTSSFGTLLCMKHPKFRGA